MLYCSVNRNVSICAVFGYSVGSDMWMQLCVIGIVAGDASVIRYVNDIVVDEDEE